MSKYQIGKDVHELTSRIEKLERTRILSPRQKPDKVASKSGLLVPEDTFEGVSVQEAKKDLLLAVDWTAPFNSPHTWDSGSGGNLFVYGVSSAKGDTGVCSIAVNAGDRSTDDSDKASRFMEAYFGFGYRNPYASGKLRVEAEFYINRAKFIDHIYDETGASAIDFLDFQRFNLETYKKVGEEYVRFGQKHSTIQQCKWKYSEGFGDKDCEKSRADEPATVVVVSDNDLEKNQLANIFVGIWAGLTLWTNDYGYQTYNKCEVRLDKVTASIV